MATVCWSVGSTSSLLLSPETGPTAYCGCMEALDVFSALIADVGISFDFGRVNCDVYQGHSEDTTMLFLL